MGADVRQHWSDRAGELRFGAGGESPLWVKSRLFSRLHFMSALPPKADINPHGLECLFCAMRRHSALSNNHCAFAHRDACGGASPRIVHAPADLGGREQFEAHRIEGTGGCAALVMRKPG